MLNRLITPRMGLVYSVLWTYNPVLYVVNVGTSYLFGRELFSEALIPKPVTHIKCVSQSYPRFPDMKRFKVPKDKVPWSIEYPEYRPVDFTAESVLKLPVWADKDIRLDQYKSVKIQYNTIDGKIDRRSHHGVYDVVNNIPRNPIGRSGMIGRGLLGRWGPNHAADPIVTRWKRDEKGKIVRHPKSGKPVLQFVSILRGDTREWAIPGGMVDPGEQVTSTLKREFGEEALDSTTASSKEKADIEKKVDSTFMNGTEVYRGYVDDPRNTDNSWMETVAYNFHDENGDGIGKFKLTAGDDAVGVKWKDIDSSDNLYASHTSFIEKVADFHHAHF